MEKVRVNTLDIIGEEWGGIQEIIGVVFMDRLGQLIGVGWDGWEGVECSGHKAECARLRP